MTRFEIETIIQRLEYQHADLVQGAYYMPHEDPSWDATEDAANALRSLMPDD